MGIKQRLTLGFFPVVLCSSGFYVGLLHYFRILENLVCSQVQKAKVILVTAHNKVSVHDPKWDRKEYSTSACLMC